MLLQSFEIGKTEFWIRNVQTAGLEIRRTSDDLIRYINRLKLLRTSIETRLNIKIQSLGISPYLPILKTYENRECQADIRPQTKDAQTQTLQVIDEIDLVSDDEIIEID